jgi:RNA polymerase sigma factor (sigma-70 family)
VEVEEALCSNDPPDDLLPDDLLLERFVKGRSDDAFRTLANRYVPLVYGVCNRWLVRADLTEDAVQSVFLLLSKKAPQLLGRTSLGGWLHSSAVNVCKTMYRAEGLRVARERQAAAVAPTEGSLGPVLDDALGRLGESDREAIVLRYLQGYSLRELGQSQRIGEDAARMRVRRAVERLRKELIKVGVPAAAWDLDTSLERQRGLSTGYKLPQLKRKPNMTLYLSGTALVAAISSLVVGSTALKHLAGVSSPPQPAASHAAPTQRKTPPPDPAKVLSAKEALTRMMRQFPGNWTWKTTVDDPNSGSSSCTATVKLSSKKVFEIRSAPAPDGSTPEFADWTPDPIAGTFLMGFEFGKPVPMSYVSGTDEGSGRGKAEFKGEGTQNRSVVDVEFSPKRFKFMVKITPKPGSSLPKPVTHHAIRPALNW